MKVLISPENFREIVTKGYSLDMICLLKMIDEQLDVKQMCESSVKIATLYSTLIRKGLITEDDEKLTLLGKELVEMVNSDKGSKITRRKPSVASSDFDEWWSAYPSTDTFVYKGKKFEGDRTLRINRDGCIEKFNKIIERGERSGKDLIGALKIDVMRKKEMSFTTGRNKLSYMQNSFTYLNQQSYEAIFDSMNLDDVFKTDKGPLDSVDI